MAIGDYSDVTARKAIAALNRDCLDAAQKEYWRHPPGTFGDELPINVDHQCTGCRDRITVMFTPMGLRQTRYVQCACGSVERVVYLP